MAAFEAETFEALHGDVVARLASGSSAATEKEAFDELRKHKDALCKPFTFRGREETLALQSLAQHIVAERPRLASEQLVKLVDEVSRMLRLHQSDCCKLVERALDLGIGVQEAPRKCAAIYYRECHFQALCLYDMAMGLAQSPPEKQSVAFFALLGGKRCIASLFDALGLLLRDLTGERAGDQVFLAHVGIMIQLLVETLLAYFSAFKATAEEAEQVLSLLPHVVTSQNAPIGQGFTISDLDLVLREEHNDVSIKLCLALACMCQAQVEGEAKLDPDPSKLREDILPSQVRLQDLRASGDSLLAGPFGQKIRAGAYWNEDSQLGQLLCFLISGVLLEDDHALGSGYIRWHVFQFLYHEVLTSSLVVACTGSLVLRILHELLQQALLPVGRKWTALKKVEVQAVAMHLMAPDSLQIAALHVLNRLCRVYPQACETFKDVVVQCTETFHLSTQRQPPDAFGNMPSGSFVPGRASILGSASPFSAPGQHLLAAAVRHDNTALYAEILDFLATICARGCLRTANLLYQKLMSHSNQWFNWNLLLDKLMEHARAPPSLPPHGHGAGGYGAGGTAPVGDTPVVVALCRLVSGACGSRLLVVNPAVQPLSPHLQSGFAAPGSLDKDILWRTLVGLLAAHPDPVVKAACLGALGNLDLDAQAAKLITSSILTLVPSLIAFMEPSRANADGAVAIELLSCVLRLLQAVPISSGRYGLDLQPLTHVVIHQVLLKNLSDPSNFSSTSRYWRLAALVLRWLRLVLRGPLPLSSSPALNAVIVRPYADCDEFASEVAMRCSAGNATAYAFRCLLSLDSPVFARMLYLVLLHGHSLEGLTDRRRGGVARPYMEQSVRIGLDVVRLLLQRDVLFGHLHAQHASDRAAAGAGRAGDACLEDGPILPMHRLLLAEFVFTYPPPAAGRGASADVTMGANPFASERPRSQALESAESMASAGGRRQNPSYLALLIEFIGIRSCHEICRLALFAFTQCALREPLRALRLLQLEPWRLQALSVALHDKIMVLDQDEALAEAKEAKKSQGKSWDKRCTAQYSYEVTEMDASPDGFTHLDVISFETGLPLCRAADLSNQIEEDSVVQAADLSTWARGVVVEGRSGGVSSLRSCSSSESDYFAAGYQRGFDLLTDWLGSGTTALAAQVEGQQPIQPPYIALATEPCRLLVLRLFVLLLGDVAPDDSSDAAPRLAQLLLGLDPDGGGSSGHVEIDPARIGNPSALDALMTLLEHPPHLPAWIESGAPRPSSSRALQLLPGNSPDAQQALLDHSAYEASLSIVLSLLAIQSLRDVMLRYMCHAWTSRYEVLRSLLGVPWSSVATPMRRVLLSEAALALQVMSWEMRLVWPAGRPPAASCGYDDIVSQQRLEVKLAVSEHLQEIVGSLLAPSDEEGAAVYGSTPCLVSAALRLADACDPVDAVVGSSGLSQGIGTPRFFLDALQEQLRATSCFCMASSAKAGGGLARSLELQDPHLCLHLAGYTGGGAETSTLSAALEQIGKNNEYACIAFHTEAACRALGTFVAAALHHLAGRPPAVGGTSARDPRSQAARAHLEALLPAMAAEEVGAEAPRRLELFSGLVTAFVAAMLERSEAPPLVFVRRVYSLLAGALTQPLAVSKEARRNLQEAMILLLQRMLPDPAVEAAQGARASQLEVEDVTKLSDLTMSLMAAAVKEADACAELCAGGLPQSQPGVSLPLLAALMTRVPQMQLGDAFQGARLWQHLSELILGSSVLGTSGKATPGNSRLLHSLQAAALAAVLCQAPGPASSFFEAGGLAALLRPEMLQSCRLRLAPPGLHALDTIHPAALVIVLQVLVAMLGVLPTHKLVLQNVLLWLQKQQQPLLDILQWVARLPLATSSEPRPRHRTGAMSGGATQPAALLAALTARGAGAVGRAGPNALMVRCQPSSISEDSSVDVAALSLSGRRSMAVLTAAASAGGSALQTEDCGEAVALCYRCVALLTELWSLLWASALKQGCLRENEVDFISPGNQDPLRGLLLQLDAPVQVALPALLAQMAAAAPPERDDSMGSDSLGASSIDGLYASEGTRLSICSNILRIWRYDSVTQQMKALAGRRPETEAQSFASQNPWTNVSQGYPTPSSSSSFDICGPSANRIAPELVSQVRVRASVLCTVFVHACSGLLGLKLADLSPSSMRPGVEGVDRGVQLQSGGGGQLHFEGVSREFRHLLLMVETALHLLCLHLTVLAAAADLEALSASGSLSGMSSLSPGAPRLALVGQYLRFLIDFTDATGGSVALAEARAPGSTADTPVTAVVNLAFAASAAGTAEKLVSQLQLQQGGL